MIKQVTAVLLGIGALFNFGHPPSTRAFTDGGFQLGLGLYSQNIAGKVTKSSDASASMTGASSYPIFVKYDWGFSEGWFISPQISFTPLARSSAGDSTETTILQLLIPFGAEITRWDQLSWDWQVGPGITLYNITGKGGIETLSNGTTTSAFARPARSVTVQTVVVELGTALNFSSSRVGLDLIFEGFLSNSKRSESLMLSYAYRL